MHDYYAELRGKYKNIVTVQYVVALTGYAKTTVNIRRNLAELKFLRKVQLIVIIFLIHFAPVHHVTDFGF